MESYFEIRDTQRKGPSDGGSPSFHGVIDIRILDGPIVVIVVFLE